MTEAWRRPTAREILIAALGTDAALLLAALLLIGFDVFLLLLALLLAAFASLVVVHPQRWVIANSVFALALYAVVLARLRLDGASLLDPEALVEALRGPLGLISVTVAAVGALTGPFAAQKTRAGIGLAEKPRTPHPRAAHARKSSR